MARLLQIAQLGNPILRAKAAYVTDLASDDVHELFDDMKASMLEVGGVGIAAPQVSVSMRVIVVRSAPSPRWPDAPVVEPFVLINPEVTAVGGDSASEYEKCLSVPGIAGLVSRPSIISIRFLDEKGSHVEQEFDGLLSRVVQHECDHLDGLVYLDRLSSTRDVLAASELAKLIL